MTGSAAQADIRGWIVEQGLEGASLPLLMEGFAGRMTAAGLTLSRAYLAIPSIDPVIRAENVTWRRSTGVVRRGVEHERWPNAFEASPIQFMLTNLIPRRRWRLEQEDVLAEFELLRELRQDGDTDYAAHIVSFGDGETTALRGVALSVCTDRPGGFTDDELAFLSALVPPLALAAYRIALSTITRTVLDAYVGHDAGSRILKGEIVRGQGHRVEAALLFADLAGFTAVADASGEGLIGRLGEHLSAIAEPIEAAGGEILKFVGDGVLAGYPIENGEAAGTACAALLSGAREALVRNAGVNARHPHNARLDLDIALHRGEVFYGNVGGGTRLDFTVIGPAVNEVSRIERLCGDLGEPLLMSGVFAACSGAPVRSLGRHALRGVGEPREIFAPA